MKKQIILIIACCGFINFASMAQTNYTNAVGLRFGPSSGITFKHHFSSTRAFEGIFHVPAFGRGVLITGLYELNQTVFDDAQFQFFYGGGAHIGAYGGGTYYVYPYDRKYYSRGFISLGVDGIIGLEWRVPTIPFTLSVDLKPTIELFNPALGFIDGGLSIRYVF